jgi:hypothetical protein
MQLQRFHQMSLDGAESPSECMSRHEYIPESCLAKRSAVAKSLPPGGYNFCSLTAISRSPTLQLLSRHPKTLQYLANSRTQDLLLSDTLANSRSPSSHPLMDFAV